MIAWLDKLGRYLAAPMPCCGRRVWGSLEERTQHRLRCSWGQQFRGPERAPITVLRQELWDRLAAECPRKATAEQHRGLLYTHVGMAGEPACSGAYLAELMVTQGHWAYTPLQLEALPLGDPAERAKILAWVKERQQDGGHEQAR